MNITPRIKSTRGKKHLIVNVSIEIPLNKQYQNSSLSPSPNHRKKYKLTQQKKTSYSNNLTYRDPSYMQTEVYPSQQPSRKKQTAPTPLPSSRGFPLKSKSTQLSPRKRVQSSRGRESKIIRNISILEQVANDEDNIIKYTTNSNQLKDKNQSLRHLSEKVETHVSEVDIGEIRDIESKYKEGRQSQSHKIANDFLRIACAKKIQRAWRRYRTKQLIRSYSNDIRKKDIKRIQLQEGLTIKTARSQGTGLKLKMKEGKQIQAKTERGFQKMTKFQEESIEKWEQMLQKIKNQKNIDKLLQISLQRSEELRNQIGLEVTRGKADFFDRKEDKTPGREKIIKTKGYYQHEREKRKDVYERSIGSVQREERVRYFENEMLKIQNDLSDASSESRTVSVEGQNCRELEEIQNLKLRKKLQIFKEHLPDIQPFNTIAKEQKTQHLPSTSSNRRPDIATIVKQKAEHISHSEPVSTGLEEEQLVPLVPTIARQSERLELSPDELLKQRPLPRVQQQLSSIQTYREWTPIDEELQCEDNKEWKQKLLQSLSANPYATLTSILQQLILQSLIEISQSQKLIEYIKSIYEQVKKKPKKPEGIVTSHGSIKDYLNYFINYLYEYKYETKILNNLLKPIGPSSTDVLKYFRGEDLPYDPDSEYVLNIKIFNEHWNYANQFIYFDPKYQDPQKEKERVAYLKQLTKVFFRAIFDCFNQSLEFQRMYGMRGKPYPWTLQKLNCQIPTLKKSLLDSFQRVIKMSTVFSGVLFQDKQHNLDKRTMDQIQQENIVKLIVIETEEDEVLWNFFQDELVEIKLEFAKYIEQRLIMEVVKIAGARLLSPV